MNEKQIKSNVVDGEILNDTISSIFEQMTKTVSRTMGPYGKNAIIQRMNSIDITKDGYLTARALNIGETIAEKALANICMDTIASTNIVAGDGTSTSIVVANELFKLIRGSQNNAETALNVRDLEDTLREAVNIVQGWLLEDAVPVTKENIEEVIHDIALVSTNWDENLAKMFADIYYHTNNPAIKRLDSGSNDTYYEIYDGYEVSAYLIQHEVYLNNFKRRLREVKKPFVLIFDSTLPDDMLDVLTVMNSCGTERNPSFNMVVMAKGYSQTFINRLASINMKNARDGKTPLPITFVEFHAPSRHDRECLLDFAELLHADIIAGDSIIRTKLDEYGKSMKANLLDNSGEKNVTFEKLKKAAESLFEELCDVAGVCGHFSVGNKFAIASDFVLSEEDSKLLENKKRKLQAEIKDLTKGAVAKTIVSNTIGLKQLRLGKLNLKMGVIYVGGYGTSHLKARQDAVDDAIRACQSCFNNGYVIGGSYAIPYVIHKNMVTKQTDIKENTARFINFISCAFFESIHTVIHNKYPSSHDSLMYDKAIVCVSHGVALNVVTEKEDRRLKNPVTVDYQVLSSAIALVITVTTSDQYLYIDYENIDSSKKAAFLEE